MAENTTDVEPRPRQSLFAWAGAVAQPREGTFGWITFAARVILGGAIAVSGFLKIGNLVTVIIQNMSGQGVPTTPQTVKDVLNYQLGLPVWISNTVGYAMPIIEILLGLAILVGLWTRWTAALGGLMMLVYIVAISSAWARGLTISCGCFGPSHQLGEGEKPMYWLDILRDIGLLICAVWIFLFPKSPLSVDGWLAGPTTTTEE